MTLSLNLVYNYNLSDYLNSFNSEFIYTSTSSSINVESLGDFVDVDLANSGFKIPVFLFQKNLFTP